jgi:hypothetical protein
VEIGSLDVDIGGLSSAAVIMVAVNRVILNSGAISRRRAHEMSGFVVGAVVMSVVVIMIVSVIMVVIVVMASLIHLHVAVVVSGIVGVAMTMAVVMKSSSVIFLHIK